MSERARGIGQGRVLVRRITMVVTLISLMMSCIFFGRSKGRGYRTGESTQAPTAGLAGAGAALKTNPRDVRPLRAVQVRNLIESTFGVALTANLAAAVSDLDISGEFDEPHAGLAMSQDRWNAILAFAEGASAHVMAGSESVQSLLAGCGAAEACAQQTYETFGAKLLKFPLLKEDAATFLGEANPGAGTDAHEAVRMTLARMLGSARLWNLIMVPDASDPNKVAPEARLWRESLFLWNEAPTTDELANAAAALADERTRGRISDARFESVWIAFIKRWLALDLLGQVQKDETVYGTVDQKKLEAFESEVVQNALAILREGRDVRDLLRAGTWSVPESLREHYAAGMVEGDRGGYLSSAAFAAITSGPYSTKPTSRGHFVMRKFLCRTVPPPPAGVGRIPDELAKRSVSAREKAEIHAKVEPCASCHRQMDPIGFVLEPLDPVGRFRADYSALNAAGFSYGSDPINATVNLPLGGDSKTFASIGDLAGALVDQEDLTRCIVQKFAEFAFGLGSGAVDPREVESVASRFGKAPLLARDLAFYITRLPSFGMMAHGEAGGGK